MESPAQASYSCAETSLERRFARSTCLTQPLEHLEAKKLLVMSVDVMPRAVLLLQCTPKQQRPDTQVMHVCRA